MGKDIERGDIYRKEIYTEKREIRRGYIYGMGTNIERRHIGKKHTGRGDKYKKKTHIERGYIKKVDMETEDIYR